MSNAPPTMPRSGSMLAAPISRTLPRRSCRNLRTKVKKDGIDVTYITLVALAGGRPAFTLRCDEDN
ncbi:hypothetical protein F4693_003162 [Sphingomonas endophytica]|uniref:Uncharacterized protein n=1 Tax=Sphingomonas endophytica TaxID=869719 RepID=A0A7X0MQI8_9SPHN|nr:hypothetical protein [Sphingomonas endophytica]MBB6506165.1 hypothetical protein [Sphingomonas endophytica]